MGGDGRLKRTRPLEPERWEKDGRIARSIRTRVHRRAKVARAEIFNIYISRRMGRIISFSLVKFIL